MSQDGKHTERKSLISYPICLISLIVLDINTEKNTGFLFAKEENVMFKEAPEVYFKCSFFT